MDVLRLNRVKLETPYGLMVALVSERGLSFLEFDRPNRELLWNQRIKKWFPGYVVVEGSVGIHEQTRKWLSDYFSSIFLGLVLPPLDLRGTEFELKVWRALMEVPVGETVSYQELAERVGQPKAARAVGGASRRNPVSLLVPCHRVIGMDKGLVGYGGGLEVKQALLNHEKK